MSERPQTAMEPSGDRVGQLAAAVVTISRAVERLASDPDDAMRRQIVRQMWEIRAMIVEWASSAEDQEWGRDPRSGQ